MNFEEQVSTLPILEEEVNQLLSSTSLIANAATSERTVQLGEQAAPTPHETPAVTPYGQSFEAQIRQKIQHAIDAAFLANSNNQHRLDQVAAASNTVSGGSSSHEDMYLQNANQKHQDDYDIVSLTSTEHSASAFVLSEHSNDGSTLVPSDNQNVRRPGTVTASSGIPASIADETPQPPQVSATPSEGSSPDVNDLITRLKTMEESFSSLQIAIVSYEDRINQLETKISQADAHMEDLEAASSVHAKTFEGHSIQMTDLERFNKTFEEKLKTALDICSASRADQPSVADDSVKLKLKKMSILEEKVKAVAAVVRAQQRMTETLIEQTSIREINRTLMRNR
ncbi:hypothetical protein I317_00333 [Kwoniella heveanensis CBS 569]|nr:hypothetical protein I317_00333 [Kwoniella heveanensis CBS 569]